MKEYYIENNKTHNTYDLYFKDPNRCKGIPVPVCIFNNKIDAQSYLSTIRIVNNLDEAKGHIEEATSDVTLKNYHGAVGAADKAIKSLLKFNEMCIDKLTNKYDNE